MAYLIVLEQVHSKPIPLIGMGTWYSKIRAPAEYAAMVHDALAKARMPAATLYFGNPEGEYTALVVEDSQNPEGIDKLTETELLGLTPVQKTALVRRQQFRKNEFMLSVNERLGQILPKDIHHYVAECKFQTTNYDSRQIQADLESQVARMVVDGTARWWIGRRIA